MTFSLLIYTNYSSAHWMFCMCSASWTFLWFINFLFSWCIFFSLALGSAVPRDFKSQKTKYLASFRNVHEHAQFKSIYYYIGLMSGNKARIAAGLKQQPKNIVKYNCVCYSVLCYAMLHKTVMFLIHSIYNQRQKLLVLGGVSAIWPFRSASVCSGSMSYAE